MNSPKEELMLQLLSIGGANFLPVKALHSQGFFVLVHFGKNFYQRYKSWHLFGTQLITA